MATRAKMKNASAALSIFSSVVKFPNAIGSVHRIKQEQSGCHSPDPLNIVNLIRRR
jgi:hypothetical protein